MSTISTAELRDLITAWRAVTSIEGNEYDEGFEAGLGEAAAQLEQLLDSRQQQHSYHVEDNVTGTRVSSKDFSRYDYVAGICRALNTPGSGGRYGVYDQDGQRVPRDPQEDTAPEHALHHTVPDPQCSACKTEIAATGERRKLNG